jgi:hypothetical protein
LGAYALKRKVIGIAILVVAFFAVAYLAAPFPTADFYVNFYPAAQSVLSGHSPYESITNATPWGIIPLVPLALLPPIPAHGVYFAVCLFVLAYIAWHLKASPLTIVAFILSPTVIGALIVGNLDPIVVSGILFPPTLGLLILLIKPQIGTGVALYYLINFVRDRKYLEAVKTFAPVVLAYSLTLIFFPIWLARVSSLPSNEWNRSLFPYSIPLGLLLVWLAVRRRNPYFALAAAPFFAPYHSFYTYTVVQIGLLHEDVERFVRRDVLHVALCIFLWVIMLVFHL